MRNVVVFSLGAGRHAIELRWVREILVGAAAAPARAHPGEGAVVLAIDDVYAALRIGAVEEVSTLPLDAAGRMVDSRGRAVALLDPRRLVAELRAAARGDGAAT